MLEQLKVDTFDLGPKLILTFVAVLVANTGAIGYTPVTTVDDESRHSGSNLDQGE